MPGSGGYDQREAYHLLQRVAGTRLTMSTFLAGFALTAFAALAPGLHLSGLPWAEYRSWPIVRPLLVLALLAAAALALLVCALATYIAMQRAGTLSSAGARALEGDEAPVLSAADAALLDEAFALYLEPWRLLSLGVLLEMAAIVLECFAIALPLGLLVAVVVVALGVTNRGLHRGLRTGLLGPARADRQRGS